MQVELLRLRHLAHYNAALVSHFIVESAHLVTSEDAEAASDTNHLDDSNEVPDDADESQDAIQQDGDGHDAQQEGSPVGRINLKLENKSPRAVFNVNVQLDASLDTEKLEKQLALLKKYGAI